MKELAWGGVLRVGRMIVHNAGEGNLRRILSVLLSVFLLSIILGVSNAQESDWTNMAPAAGPSGRGGHDMAYDSESDRIVLFGGTTSPQGPPQDPTNDETWAYDFNSNTWTNMTPNTRPASRFFHAMAYDAESDRVVLFGGFFRESPETWAYDLNANAWTNMSPAIQPTAWVGADMAYDAESDRVVLFGGGAAATLSPPFSAVKDETWAYDFNTNTWTNMTPSTAPSRRLHHGMAYDAQSDRIVLFSGGTSSLDANNETWAYDFNANSWTEMNPQVAPSPRGFHSMASDGNSDRVVLFGGFTPPTAPNDETWVYDFNNDAWIQTDSGMGPSRRGVAAMAYDAESDRVILSGGGTGSEGLVINDETWAHRFVPPPPPPLWISVVVGVVVAAVAVAALLILRSRGKRKGEG